MTTQTTARSATSSTPTQAEQDGVPQLVNKAASRYAERRLVPAAASNGDWAHAPGYYLILTDQAGAKSWPSRRELYPRVRSSADAAATAEALKFFNWPTRAAPDGG